MRIALAALAVAMAMTTPSVTKAASLANVYAETRMKPCCLEAAEMNRGCCGYDESQVHQNHDRLRAADRALASAGFWYVTAVLGGTGYFGRDAAAVQADFTTRLAVELPRVMAIDHLPACCAAAVDAYRGCCGKDAAALAATFAQEIAAARERLMATEGC